MFKVLPIGTTGTVNFETRKGSRLSIGADNPANDTFVVRGYLHTAEEFPARKAYTLESGSNFASWSTSSTMAICEVEFYFASATTGEVTLEILDAIV